MYYLPALKGERPFLVPDLAVGTSYIVALAQVPFVKNHSMFQPAEKQSHGPPHPEGSAGNSRDV